MKLTVSEKIELAAQAAYAAGKTWIIEREPELEKLRSGVMYDLCGTAHVQFKDKRRKDYKEFKAAGYVSEFSGVIEIPYEWKSRQEHDLQLVCATAAKNALEALGVSGLRIWDYID
ncbi:MAG: hypothetical protein QXN55_00455 [Candidatus Nitrosotenuis sp.]